MERQSPAPGLAAAVDPIDPAVVSRVLEDHQRVHRERAELVATLDRLAPGVAGAAVGAQRVNRVLGT